MRFSTNPKQRCLFLGPPETMREHIVAAAKAMKKGDWKKCAQYILAVKVCFTIHWPLNCRFSQLMVQVITAIIMIVAS